MNKRIVGKLVGQLSCNEHLFGTLNHDIETIASGTQDHRELLYRNLPDQHPISSITGLSEALGGKADGIAILNENHLHLTYGGVPDTEHYVILPSDDGEDIDLSEFTNQEIISIWNESGV